MIKLHLEGKQPELDLITNLKKNNTLEIWIYKSILRYVRVVIDAKLSFKGPLDYPREKVVKVSSSLAKMIPKIGRSK